MKKTSLFVTPLALALLGLTALSYTPQAFAQTTLAKWTFEVSQPGVVTLPAAPGAGVWLTNIVAEVGSGVASGKHASASTYSSPGGNGSARAYSSTAWSIGDMLQFATGTAGYQDIIVSFDQTSSGTGPSQFNLQYSTDGVNFTQFGSTYTVLPNAAPNPTWNVTTASAIYSYTFNLASVTALNNAAVVYFRLVDASTVSANGGVVAAGGTSRVDNFTVLGSIPGTPTFTVNLPSATNVFAGDTVTLSVVANGTAPLAYQWYYPNLSTPVVGGWSGFGAGTNSGATNATLVMTYADVAQAGNYRVVVTNGLGAITSVVCAVTVNVPVPVGTNIAYLHTLQDANFVLTNTSTLFAATGVVTTPVNLVSGSSVYSFHIQDASGGIDVFNRGGFTTPLPALGDRVRVVAPLLQFNGTMEMAPVFDNSNHKIEVIDSNNPLPVPTYFDFTTVVPATMESTYEARYVVVSNVFLALTNTTGGILAGTSIYMTNLSGQTFRLVNPAAAIGPQGLTPPAFATSVKGVMTQVDSTSPFSDGYSIYLFDMADIEAGTPPSPSPSPAPLSINKYGNDLVLSWTNAVFNLQAAPAVTGVYTNILGAASPYTNSVGGDLNFFRLKYP